MEIALVTAADTPAEVLSALGLLPHAVRIVSRDVRPWLVGDEVDVVLVDARGDLADGRSTCRRLRAGDADMPIVAVMAESGLAAVAADWGADDVILTVAGPAEVETRLRLAHGRRPVSVPDDRLLVRAGALVMDPDRYTATLHGRRLQLTYKEFELLTFLARQPGRVFSRGQLLRDVWGYDYFGGTRTVDVHVRRLRAKLGSEYESMIGTVRQVGYKLVLAPARQATPDRVSMLAAATA